MLDRVLYRGAPRRLESRFRYVRGCRVHERFGGERGPRVVFVHGIGVSGRYLLPTAGRVAARCRVFVPDLPGFGRSSRSGLRFSVARVADDLSDWLDEAAVERPLLVGNSFGCQLLVEVASRRPAHVAALVLVGPTIDAEARSLARQAGRLALDAAREPLVLDLLQVFDYCVFAAKSGIRPFAEMLRDPIEEKLRAVEAPAVVVRGTRDPIVPRQWATQLAAALPKGRLVEVPGAPHVVNYSAPDALAELVLELASTVPDASS